MSEPLQIWLFCVEGGWLLGLTALFYHQSLCLARIKTAMLFMGKNAMKALHSPDDHLGVDAIVEKYNRTNDLTLEEWAKVQQVCDQLLNNNRSLKTEQLAASQVQACLFLMTKLSKELAIYKQTCGWKSRDDSYL